VAKIEADVEGGYELASEFTLKAAKLGAQVFTVVNQATRFMQGRVVVRASGRPGPRRRTGDYTRSWQATVSVRGDEVVGETGTNAPQARRLEHGFTGVDALGRHYNQPPYPHARPALLDTQPMFELGLLKVISS
jgi:hypothetical protein